jgi:hypothetical protein
LKPEWWGSPLVQEGKYQEKPVKREEEIIMIIIIHFFYFPPIFVVWRGIASQTEAFAAGRKS